MSNINDSKDDARPTYSSAIEAVNFYLLAPSPSDLVAILDALNHLLNFDKIRRLIKKINKILEAEKIKNVVGSKAPNFNDDFTLKKKVAGCKELDKELDSMLFMNKIVTGIRVNAG